MSTVNIIRAWKDPSYRKGLSASERAAVPANPAGTTEISDQDLNGIAGGLPKLTVFEPCTPMCSLGCPSAFCSILPC